MDKVLRVWWVMVAGAMAVLQTVFAFGNLMEDDGGPLYGQLVLIAVAVVGAACIAAGTVARAKGRAWGSTLIGVGVLPSAGGILLFWFPPAFLYGVLAIAVVVFAFRDSSGSREPEPGSVITTS